MSNTRELQEQNAQLEQKIKQQQAEIERLKMVEKTATRFHQMIGTPDGIDLYVGAVYEAVDKDGDGFPDDLVLLSERPDTFGLTPTEQRKSAELRAQLDSVVSTTQRQQALEFTAAHAPLEGSGTAEGVLEQAVADAESQ